MTHSPRRPVRGFTLIELMIALTVGGIAISALYALGSASTRHFREQNRISTTQSSLRAAMAQLKRDFQRAGFLATPNASIEQERCTPVGDPLNDPAAAPGKGRLAAISAYHKNVAPPSALDPDRLNAWATVDEVTLMGNYSTSGEYMGVVLAANGRSATIPSTTHSFRRDFTNWYASGGAVVGSCNQVALTNAFPADRLVRLHALNDRNAYVQVASAVCDDVNSVATITFRQQVLAPCNVTSGWISPINTIRYHVANATGVETTRIGDNRVAQLRRTEVDPGNKANPLDITIGAVTRRADDRAVLDYVVRFDVNFLMRGNADVNTLNWEPATVDQVRLNPERVRGVMIELAVRTPEHEPDMDVTGAAMRLPPFRVFDTQGAARTRALRAELLLANIAHERL